MAHELSEIGDKSYGGKGASLNDLFKVLLNYSLNLK